MVLVRALFWGAGAVFVCGPEDYCLYVQQNGDCCLSSINTCLYVNTLHPFFVDPVATGGDGGFDADQINRICADQSINLRENLLMYPYVHQLLVLFCQDASESSTLRPALAA